MSKKTFWLIVGAAIIVALAWVSVKHMRNNNIAISTEGEVVEEIVESGDPAEIPVPTAVAE